MQVLIHAYVHFDRALWSVRAAEPNPEASEFAYMASGEFPLAHGCDSLRDLAWMVAREVVEQLG